MLQRDHSVQCGETTAPRVAILQSLPKQLNLLPRSSRLMVQKSGNFAALLTSFFKYHKILPNLVDNSWL